MKKLFTLLVLLIPITVLSQFTNINPDTVCYQSPTPSTYQVVPEPDVTYTWIVDGTLISGQGTTEIVVDWSSFPPGLITTAIGVYATNINGCNTEVFYIDVFVLNIVPIIQPLEFCEGDPCVDLVGTPIGGTWSGTNIVGNQYCPDIAGTFPITYTITEAGCVFSTTSNNIITNVVPIILDILHD